MFNRNRDSVEFSDYWSFGSDSEEVSNFKDALYVLDGEQGEKVAIYDQKCMPKRVVTESERYSVEHDGEIVCRTPDISKVNEVLTGIETFAGSYLETSSYTSVEAEEE